MNGFYLILVLHINGYDIPSFMLGISGLPIMLEAEDKTLIHLTPKKIMTAMSDPALQTRLKYKEK